MEVDHPSEIQTETTEHVLFREKETQFIVRFMGPETSLPHPCLFIYGHTATGKTLVLNKLFNIQSIPNVWINCHEFYTSQLIFSSVLQQLSKDHDGTKKVSSSVDFIESLKSKLCDRKQTTYIVFDCAEVLRKEDPFLLSSLVRLQQLCKVNICTILISELPWTKFRTQHTTFKPITLHFDNYTKSQMMEILGTDCPPDYERGFYDGYINVIMKTFFTVTRNLGELRHLAEVNFKKYCEPLEDDPEYEVGCMRLWKNIEPTLKEAMSGVYLREVSGSKWKSVSNSKPDPSSNVMKSTSDLKLCVTRELPFYSKFLLLSAYFASYNPPKSDFKHFVKNQGKQAKKRVTRKMEKNRHLLGPKPFSLDRMLSIFFTVVGERVLPSALIFSQISSLASMRLIARVSADEQLDCPKYKCLAELDLVEKIGKTVNIDVRGYLDDFL